MPNDVDEVLVAADVAIHFAPVGTAGPTDEDTALNAAFVNVGYIAEDSLNVTPSTETNAVRAHQAVFPIRHVLTGRTMEFGMSLLQWNEETIKLAFGGGSTATNTGTYTYTPPDADDGVYYRAMVIEIEDGTKLYRWHAPKVMVSDVGEIPFAASDAVPIPITVSVVMVDGAQPFSFITNDAGFASA